MGLTRGKTDQVDAKPVRRCGIALFAYKNREEARLWNPPRTVIAQLDRLTAQRARLVKVIKQLQTPLTDSKGFIDKADRKAEQQACAGSLKALKADLKSADKAIIELAQADSELKRLFERVTSVIGISQITAAEIIVTTNEFKSITDPKRCACYAGVVPFDRIAEATQFRAAKGQVSSQPHGQQEGKVLTSFSRAACAGRCQPFSIVLNSKPIINSKSKKARTKCCRADFYGLCKW